MESLELLIGKTYYQVTYADPGMTMPGVMPLVYLGEAVSAENESFHVFQDTVSYVRYGSRLDPGAVDRDDLAIYFIPPAVVGSGIVSLNEVVQLTQDCLERAVSAGWPALPVLRDGWSPAT